MDPSTTRDYIDCYLNKIQKVKTWDGMPLVLSLWSDLLQPNFGYLQTNLEPDSTFHEENLVVCVWDLFLAGTDTTTCTLRWLFLFMAKYPEMQGKCPPDL